MMAFLPESDSVISRIRQQVSGMGGNRDSDGDREGEEERDRERERG